jgi:hypothetical protein
MKRNKKKDPVSCKQADSGPFCYVYDAVLRTILQKRMVPMTAKTVAAEGILSFVSPLSRLSGYPPYRILRKFTQQATAVRKGESARDLTGPWGGILYLPCS